LLDAPPSARFQPVRVARAGRWLNAPIIQKSGTMVGMHRPETPFDSLENAHEYVRLLAEAIAEARGDIESDIAKAVESKSERRLQALRLVQYKLGKLEHHLRNSSRTLNDLRTLRRLLLEERSEPDSVRSERAS
jgi:hypothetical protein